MFPFTSKKKKQNNRIGSFDYQPQQGTSKKQKSYSFQQRIRFIVVNLFLCSFLLCILVRSAYLQISQPARILEQAKKQSKKVFDNVYRGSIYDNNHNVLAGVLPVYSLYLRKNYVHNIEKTANKLTPFFANYKANDLIDLYNQSGQKKILLSKYISSSVYNQLHELNAPEFLLTSSYVRIYPWGRFLANTLGFTGGNLVGREGIEYYYNYLLLNDNTVQVNGNPFNSTFFGSNVHLTIDSRMQYAAMHVIEKANQAMHAKGILAAVMESKTGKILVNAYTPTFNPNKYQDSKVALYANPLIHTVYEPGSTFKVITLASALETHSIEPEQQFFCENGIYYIYNTPIHDTSAHGWLSVSQVLQKSSNICASKIAFAMGKSAFYHNIQKFGFGTLSGINLPGESVGIVNKNLQSWKKFDLAALSFGHFIAVTPIQLLKAVNTIASGGYLVTPSIVSAITDKNNKPIPLKPNTKKLILSRETVKWLTKYMISVTQKGGTGFGVKPHGLAIAGKTGTARKFDIKTHSYSKDDHVFSFIGFFPADHPVLTMLVIVDDPKAKYKHATSAVPIFREITEKIINYYPLTSAPMANQARIPKAPIAPPVAPLTAKLVRKTLYKKTLRESLLWASRERITLRFKGSGRIYRVVADSNKNQYTAYLK